MSSPYYDNILSTCWSNDIFVYPLHLGGDRFNIEVFRKDKRNVDEVVYNQVKAKKKVLEYYKFFYNNLVNKK